MSESAVQLELAGRSYAVACAPGEEARVAALGALIGEKLAGLPADVAASESRSLLFAALLLADELAEWREGLAPPPAPPAATLARLGNIALKIEQLADLFEAFGTAPG